MSDIFAKLGLSFTADNIPSAEALRFELREGDFEKLLLTGVSALHESIAGAFPTSREAVPSTVSVASTAGGTTLVAASTTPRKATVYNAGSTPVTISDGGTPVVGSAGTAVIQPGGFWSREEPAKSAVKGIVSSGTASCFVTLY